VIAWYSFIFLLFLPFPLFSQLSIKPFNFKLSGYIKGELYGDSRQTTSALEDDLNYFPKEQTLDPAGNDINARAQTIMDAFETRMRLDMDGPSYENFSVKGTIETDFEVFTRTIINNMEMRHAFCTIQFKQASFLIGQAWHPMVFVEPPNINYNGATPYDYYARSPQFTFTYRTAKNLDIIASATTEIDYVSTGPNGPSSQYMRLATAPNIHLQLRWSFHDHVMGIGGDYKRITPRLESTTGFKVHERISSGAAVWYLGLKWPVLEILAKINCGQNVFGYNGLGGYAVAFNSINPITGEQKYANLNNAACWADIAIVKYPYIIPGMFFGFAKNLKASRDIDLQQPFYAFVPNVDVTFRIAPRLSGKINNMTFSAEVEYTRAYYGTLLSSGAVIDTVPVDCIRCTFASYYYF
jgi:hypothetical protein